VRWVTAALVAGFLGLVTIGAADAVDEYVRSQLKPRYLPGVSVAVVKDGRLVKAAGYGLASLELDAPATEKTVYESGSISRSLPPTAAS
jgi:CubicO group peptidase (beta-lactamase class C family)